MIYDYDESINNIKLMLFYVSERILSEKLNINLENRHVSSSLDHVFQSSSFVKTPNNPSINKNKLLFEIVKSAELELSAQKIFKVLFDICNQEELELYMLHYVYCISFRKIKQGSACLKGKPIKITNVEVVNRNFLHKVLKNFPDEWVLLNSIRFDQYEVVDVGTLCTFMKKR